MKFGPLSSHRDVTFPRPPRDTWIEAAAHGTRTYAVNRVGSMIDGTGYEILDLLEMSDWDQFSALLVITAPTDPRYHPREVATLAQMTLRDSVAAHAAVAVAIVGAEHAAAMETVHRLGTPGALFLFVDEHAIAWAPSPHPRRLVR